METSGKGIDIVYSTLSFSVRATDVENLTLEGSANLTANSNGLANRLTGNAGKNVLNGGLGNDSMSGGAGRDAFVFDTAIGTGNVDQIADFSVNGDTIRLDDAIFPGLATGRLAASAFAAKTTGHAATLSDRIIHETDTGRLYFDVDGIGGAARVLFANVGAGLSLTNEDIFVI